MQLPEISGKSPLARAIRYALSRMSKTLRYLDNGFLDLDNNTIADHKINRIDEPSPWNYPDAE
jgi:hypothetical protein